MHNGKSKHGDWKMENENGNGQGNMGNENETYKMENDK